MHAGRGFLAVLGAGLFVFFLSAVGAEAAPRTSPEQAAKFMHTLSGEALTVLGSQQLSLEQREAQVRTLLSKSFDFERIGRFVLGKAWRKATPEQQAEYLDLFKEYILRTYSRRLGGYSGQTFSIVKAEPIGKLDALVSTEIGRPSGPPLKAGWRVRNGPEGHKIRGVSVEGISMLTAQRDEFTSLVRRQGVDGLIETLRMQVTKFAARSS